MSDQTLDLRRSFQLLWRHKIVVAISVALGLAAGVGLIMLRPAMLTSSALVVLPSSVHNVATQVVIATSDPVLNGALKKIDPGKPPQTLRSVIKVKSLTSDILSISAQGKTATQAERTADAVADSYVAYVNSPSRTGPPVQARILQPALTATATPLPIRLLITGGLGALLGLLIGVIVVLATSRRDRRLRKRDEIADSIGIPVLASVSVSHPSDAAGWTKLLEDYQPGAVDAWRLRKLLRHLGLTASPQTDPRASSPQTDPRASGGYSLAVLSLSSDPKALALGPQLAVFAASLGIPAAFVVGPQQDVNTTAMLRAACAAPSEPPRRSRNLRVAVSDHHDAARLPPVRLTVVAAVVDGQTPRVADTMRTTATTLGISSGTVTAEQLARVTASAAADGRDIAGILVADPDSADHTTGRLPELARPAHRKMPTRITSPSLETRR
jgi:capsular polysaccharide biosynthesis protein